MHNALIFLIFILPVACSGLLLFCSSAKKFKKIGTYLSPIFVIVSLSIVSVMWIQKNFSFFVSYNWFNIFDFYVDWSIKIDTLSLSMITMILIVTFSVQLCSLWYLRKNVVRFFIYVNLFSFFMTLLVASGNLLQLFLCWEAVGLFSYLLIGFYYDKESCALAGFKAFIINRFGDLFFVLGVVLFYQEFNTLNFSELSSDLISGSAFRFLSLNLNSIEVICSLFLVGCASKSAQIFLHGWLIDAMEGPTTASALIHAATMVTAGVFFVVRCSDLYNMSIFASGCLVFIGASTALLCSAAAVFQSDVKKIVAYSTCSQLGFMFVAVGLKYYDTAMLYLFAHSFFKSLMFLCIGIALKYNSNNKDIYSFSHAVESPIFSKICSLIACFSLIGLFPFSGFYSKNLIFEHISAFSDINKFGKILFYVILFSSAFTCVYTMKLLACCFFAKRRIRSRIVFEGIENFISLLPLSILSCVFGYFAINFLKISGVDSMDFWSDNSIVTSKHLVEGVKSHSYISYIIIIVSLVSFYCFRNTKIAFKGKLGSFLQQVWFSSCFYNYLSLFFIFLCRMLDEFFDFRLLNRFISFSVPRYVGKSCQAVKLLHSSSITSSILFLFIGLLILIGCTFLFV